MKDKKDLEVSYFEIDNNTYLVSKVINYNNDNYLLLVNEDNEDDIFIRKYDNNKLVEVPSKKDLYNIISLM